MSVVLNLSPDRERRLKSFAARQGKPEAEIIEAWIDAVPVSGDPTEALFAKWKAEEDVMTEEEREEEARKAGEMMVAVLGEAHRKSTGERTIALLQQWKAEDAQMTENEKEEADRDTEELLANLRAYPLTIGREAIDRNEPVT